MEHKEQIRQVLASAIFAPDITEYRESVHGELEIFVDTSGMDYSAFKAQRVIDALEAAGYSIITTPE